MRKYRNRILAGFAIGFMIYLGLLIFINTDDLIKQLETFPWALLVPVILLKFGSWFFRFLEWHYYLGVIGARSKIAVGDSAALFVAGFTMAVSPGKAAEVLKSFVLKSKTGVPVAESAPVVIAERVVDGLSVILLAFLALVLAGDALDLGPYRALIFISAGLLVLGLVAVQIRPLARFGLSIIARLPLVRRLHRWLSTFYESSFEIFKLKHVIPTTGFGIVASLGDAIGFTIILSGFGVEITWLVFLQALVIVCLSAAIGALSGVPNGAGITEISVSAMLLLIVAPQNPIITPPIAAAAALIEGFFHKWFRVLVGLAVAIVFRHRLFGADFEAVMKLEEQMPHRQQNELGMKVSGL